MCSPLQYMLPLLSTVLLICIGVTCVHCASVKEASTLNSAITPREIITNGEYFAHLGIDWTNYGDVLSFEWVGVVNDIQNAVAFESSSVVQLQHENPQLYVAVFKASGDDQFYLEVWSDPNPNLLSTESQAADVSCTENRCSKPVDLTTLQTLKLNFILAGNDILVRMSQQGTSINAVRIRFEEAITGLAPSYHEFALSKVASCNDLPSLHTRVTVPKLMTLDTGALLQTSFNAVSTSVESTCNVKLTSNATTVSLAIVPTSNEMPAITGIPPISKPPTACNPIEWEDVIKDAAGGTLYSGGTGWFSYKFDSIANDQWQNIYYPIMFTEYTHPEIDHYYAFYTPVGYTGYQPHPNAHMKLIFSSFSADAYPISSNCHRGADSYSGGTSCSTQIENWQPYEVYFIHVHRINSTAVEAFFLRDGYAPELIGSYFFLQESSIKALDGNSGFIEDFDYSEPSFQSCCTISHAEALIFGMFTTDEGGKVSTDMDAGQYGCSCPIQATNTISKFYSTQLTLPGSDQPLELPAVLLRRGWLL